MPVDTAAQTIGVEAGLALGSLSSYQSNDVNESFGTAQRRGTTVGLFVDVSATPHLALELGVGIVEKGARLTVPGATNDTVAIAKLSYLEMPVLLRVDAARLGVRPFGLVGPSFGINLAAHVDASASGGPSSVDVGNELRTADVGVVVGAGLTDGRWFAEIRWTQGLIDVGESRRVDDVVRTRTVSILAGIRF
jgi:hypothetical protein